MTRSTADRTSPATSRALQEGLNGTTASGKVSPEVVVHGLGSKSLDAKSVYESSHRFRQRASEAGMSGQPNALSAITVAPRCGRWISW